MSASRAPVQRPSPGVREWTWADRANAAETARGSLALRWYYANRQQKEGAVAPKAGCPGFEYCCRQFEAWCRERGLGDLILRTENRVFGGQQIAAWTYEGETVPLLPHMAEDNAVRFHGMDGYALWNVLDAGILLEAYDEGGRGHEFARGEGVYTTPFYNEAAWYGKPSHFFRDGFRHRVVLELAVSVPKHAESQHE